jgi:oxygen-dependent protoporphyrinogen oxidase
VKQTCILGSGICGLTSAWKRQREGTEITVIDSSSRVGGIIESQRHNGFLLDYGPNTLSLRLRKTKDLLENAKILDHAIDANPEASKRFIVRNGDLMALPTGFTSFFSSKFLSARGKLRLLIEPFLPRGKDVASESVASFVARRLGNEALQYGANPFLAGVYAARPESLCLRHAFPSLHQLEKERRSLFLGMMSGFGKSKKITKPRLLSFPEGMNELPDRLHAQLEGKFLLGHQVTEVTRLSNGWQVTASDPSGTLHQRSFDEVICTIPAHKLETIKWTGVAQAAEISSIAEATHFPLSLVFLGFEKKDVSHPLDGFGFLVPEIEKLDILGSLFSSTLFPGRAPAGKVLLTTFVGGERNPELALSDEDLLCSQVTDQLSPLLGIRGKPVFQHVKTWRQAIPLPDFGFDGRKKAAETLQEANPGLSFSGSHIAGAPLPNCLDVP